MQLRLSLCRPKSDTHEKTQPTLVHILLGIKVWNDHYTFFVNEVNGEVLRTSTTGKGSVYRLYPYFGGDEPAPHGINIWIKEQ